MLEFDPERHEYRLNGALLPSVTQILAPLYDFGNVPPEILERKRVIGDHLHTAIALSYENDLDVDSLSANVMPFYQAFRNFQSATDFVPEVIEKPIHHPLLRYAGTPDAVGRFRNLPRMKGKRVLLDWKATYTLSPIVGIQTAAYADAFNCHHKDDPVTARLGVQLRPDGTFALEHYKSQIDGHIFNSLLSIHNWRKRYL